MVKPSSRTTRSAKERDFSNSNCVCRYSSPLPWLEFREENILCYLNEEDKKHKLFIDEIYEKVLKNVPQQNRKYVEKQLNELEKNFMAYLSYWNEKYYRNGFVDGVQLAIICFGK